MDNILYLNKKDEVFEWCVEVGLFLQLHDRVKVLVVDVSIDPEQALQNGLCHRHKVSLEGDTFRTRGHKRKAVQIIQNNNNNNITYTSIWKESWSFKMPKYTLYLSNCAYFLQACILFYFSTAARQLKMWGAIKRATLWHVLLRSKCLHRQDTTRLEGNANNQWMQHRMTSQQRYVKSSATLGNFYVITAVLFAQYRRNWWTASFDKVQSSTY